MKKLGIKSINLSIISLGIAVFYYIFNFFPIISISSIGTFDKTFALIESIIAVLALIMGIKEKNKTFIVLALLLLIIFLKPFLFLIATKMYWSFQ
jgi:hypothetical protein